MEQLTQAQHKAAEALYKHAGRPAAARRRARAAPGAEGAAGSARAASNGAATSIDAEVVDDKK